MFNIRQGYQKEEKVEEGEIETMMMELPLDADGAACCRLHLPDHLPHAGLHDGYTFLQKVSRAILISHLLLHFAFSRIISLS